MTNYDKKILNHLVDKYERSKSFIGENKTNQRFSEQLKKIFPKYADTAEYDVFRNINEAVAGIERLNYISVKPTKNAFEKTVILNTDRLDDIYSYLNRQPKAALNESLLTILEKYKDENEILRKYCTVQIDRIKRNKSIERFDGDITDFENTLKAVKEIFYISDETYQRDFSIRLFSDSKVFERIRNKVAKILFKYGDFPDEESVLEDMNIVKNPGHVYLKGKGRIRIAGQEIDLSILNGDIAISSDLLKSIDEIRIDGQRIITIENLTTFNRFNDSNALTIYLGGYHNTHRRNFIKKIYESNPDKEYLHYGDIDAGGFLYSTSSSKKNRYMF